MIGMSDELAISLRDMYTSTYKALELMTASMFESARQKDYDGVLRTLAAMHDVVSMTNLVGSTGPTFTEQEHGV